jgi:UDP-N-acetylglucosamine--N-acetylmuramyl-(pentapeptide) pyrophosphoryl-undecaprenol N-acetylglucosamine transferase
MKFVMAGGGTGGHVIPALAVAQELKRRGHVPVFFGTARGYEARLVPAAGFPLETIEVGGLNRVGLLRKLRTVWLLPWSAIRVWKWMSRERPSAVFSMGGYVAGPPLIAAILRRVPIVAMEPNAVPGMTNRNVSRWIAKALVNFEETLRFFPPGRAEVSGVPVRDEFFSLRHRPHSEPFTVLVTGGSQGSRTLNAAARESWPLFAEAGMRVRFIHQAGRGNAEELTPAFRESGLAGEVVEFIPDMPAAFAEADLVVCRAGASTVAELAAAAKPSILVPFPYAADDHQRRNAEAMERAGAARLVSDGEMTGRKLFDEVSRFLSAPELLRQMGENAGKLGKPGAAARAADVLEALGASPGR